MVCTNQFIFIIILPVWTVFNLQPLGNDSSFTLRQKINMLINYSRLKKKENNKLLIIQIIPVATNSDNTGSTLNNNL